MKKHIYTLKSFIQVRAYITFIYIYICIEGLALNYYTLLRLI